MEARFGVDLRHVRVHSGPLADRSTRDLGTPAYAAGASIVFRTGRYAPATRQGRHVLAHEIAHTLQQQNAPGPAVMGYGRTASGFFANLFRTWDYSPETIEAYLALLDRGNRIEDDDNSDDKARQVVAEWKETQAHTLSVKIRILLVREMLDGFVSRDDQDAIMDLLEGSGNAELVGMFQPGQPNALSVMDVRARFGSRQRQFDFFTEKVLAPVLARKAVDARAKGRSDADEARATLSAARQQLAEHGYRFSSLLVSFDVAPGTLYESFAVDLVVPSPGTQVSITLGRKSLDVTFSPQLFVDVAWPVDNASLRGCSLAFPGLEPSLQLTGPDLVESKAESELHAFMQGLFFGTRFARADYAPIQDPEILGDLYEEVSDPGVVGDVNRVRYNFLKNLDLDGSNDRGKDDAGIAEQVSDPFLEHRFTLTEGLVLRSDKSGLVTEPVPESNELPPGKDWSLVIQRGSAVNLRIALEGRASELMERSGRLGELRIDTDGVYLYRGDEKIVMLTSISMGPGLDVKLEDIRAFVDLKKVFREEFPGEFSETVTEWAEDYDNLADNLDRLLTLGGLIGEPSPKSDIALELAAKASETVLGWLVGSLLRQYWDDIRTKADASDEQLEDFIGL